MHCMVIIPHAPQDSDPIGLAHAFSMALRSEKEDVVAALIDFQVMGR